MASLTSLGLTHKEVDTINGPMCGQGAFKIPQEKLYLGECAKNQLSLKNIGPQVFSVQIWQFCV